MKLRDVSISKGMTINLGNYNTHRVEIGMTAVFDETDDYETGVAKLTAMVNGKLAAEVNAAMSEMLPQKKGKTKRPVQVLMEDEHA